MAVPNRNQNDRIVFVSEKLQFDFNCELGRGISSTVYKGRFEDMPVAVKTIKCKDAADAKRTIESFKESRERKIMNMVEKDRHKNIIGYYVSEIHDDTMYLAMELCNGNLTHYIERDALKKSYPAIKVNFDIASGVAFLHSKNIAHRDLKPENVYFVTKDRNTIIRIVIGDFGTSKWTVDECFSMSVGGSQGTVGYIAHEVWKEMKKSGDVNPRNKMNLKSDIFALGCVFYYTTSVGYHPFGEHIERQFNIQQKQPPTIDKIEKFKDPIKQLIVKMLNHDPSERPTAQEAMQHPSLWSADRKLGFLSEVSDDLRNADATIRDKLENPDVIWKGNWGINLPTKLKTHLNNYTSNRGRHIYRDNGQSVYGLLRTIRNTANHYKNFPGDVQRELGAFPEGHLEIWMRVCPLLLMHVYHKAAELNLPAFLHQVQRADTSSDTHSQATPKRAPDERPRLQGATSFIDEHMPSEQGSQQLSSQRPPTAESPNTYPKVVDINCDVIGSNIEPTGLATLGQVGTQPYQAAGIQQQEIFPGDSSSIRKEPPIGKMYQLSIHDKQPHAGADSFGNSNKTATDTEIVIQKQKLHVPDASHWAMYAGEEIENAKQMSQTDVEGKVTVLCVDISESMTRDGAWTQVKQFVGDVLQGMNGLAMFLGENKHHEHLAITTFGHTTKVIQRASNNIEELQAAFNSIKLGGPSPMYGGFMLGMAAIATLEGLRAKPCVVLISDFRPTETTCYAGPDRTDDTTKDETASQIIELLTRLSSQVNVVFVPVGDVDKDFLNLLVDVTSGKCLTYDNGREIITGSLMQGSLVSSKDMYKEITDGKLPVIGSRVVRGPDWKHDNQDSNGPGTIIGHGEDSTVWVQWDANGHQNIYRWGHGDYFDLLPSEHMRKVTEFGTLNVGCVVVNENECDKGVVIKVIGNGKIHVRWENGQRGDYGFGNDVFEVWPWTPDEVGALSSDVTDVSPPGRQEERVHGTTPKKGINKNLHPGRGKRH